MRGRLTIIPPTGDVTVMHYDAPIPLADLQLAVSGYIEVVPGFRTVPADGRRVPCVVFCNEHGKLDRLPPNDTATALWADAVAARHRDDLAPPLPDFLVGTIAIVTGDDEFLSEL